MVNKQASSDLKLKAIKYYYKVNNYSKVCKINHSCEPNIVVTYRMTPSEGLVAVVQALKEIKCNDELLHSYIDNTDDRETRKTALKEYGFDCHCNKCQKECNE